MWRKAIPVLFAAILFPAQLHYESDSIMLADEGTNQGKVNRLNCTGTGVACSKSGATGTINASGGGGSDPWTYVILSGDFPTTSSSAVDVTGMNFTPAASTRYEIEGRLLLRTATATVVPRPGVAWPTGMTDGVVNFRRADTAATQLFQSGNIAAAVLMQVGGLPNTTQSWPAILAGMLIAGSSPSGTFRLQLASETSGTSVTIKAGSFFRYRTF